jgi:hypothetical protein
MKGTATAMIVTAALAFGHHSFQGNYFLDQQMTVRGKIAVLLFRNPHSYLELDAPDETGQIQRWSIEMGAMLPLSKRGITRDTLKAGDEVTITMSPPREPAPGKHTGVLKTLYRPADGFEWGTKPGEVPKEWASD